MGCLKIDMGDVSSPKFSDRMCYKVFLMLGLPLEYHLMLLRLKYQYTLFSYVKYKECGD
jgi:hypothetical protein